MNERLYLDQLSNLIAIAVKFHIGISRFKQTLGFIAVLSTSLILLSACSGSKSMAKKGDQLMEAGMYTEAAAYYYSAVVRNSKNIDAQIALKTTGQQVYNDKIDVFTKAKVSGDDKAAVYSYQDAAGYRDKLSRVGVQLETPNHIDSDYDESKIIYAESLYKTGRDQIDNSEYAAAKATFKELMALVTDYKDSAELQNIANNEPHYLAGKKLMDEADYRSAYYAFDKVYKIDKNYRQTESLRAECLERGQYPIAISPFENASGKKDIEKRINAFVITDLSGINNPFLKVVDRAQMESILEEQRLGMTGVIDEETAAQAGNLLGAKIMITGTVLSYTPQIGRAKVESHNGYESFQVKRYDKANDKTYYDTKYKAVKYKTYTNANAVSISFQYKAISLESGEILFSRVVEKNLSSSVRYATYDGEVNKLFPAGANGVVTSNSARKNLQNLIRANRTLKSIDQLSNEGYSAISKALEQDVEAHINSL